MPLVSCGRFSKHIHWSADVINFPLDFKLFRQYNTIIKRAKPVRALLVFSAGIDLKALEKKAGERDWFFI
jgi:hypothetical protein